MTSDPEELRNQMARIRAGARWKAVQIKRETKQLTDWKYYVKSYPWLIAGGAILLGYLLVPARRGPPAPAVPSGPSNEPSRGPVRQETVETAAKTGVLAGAAALIWTVVSRVGMNYATRRLTQLLTDNTAYAAKAQAEAHRDHEHAFDRSSYR